MSNSNTSTLSATPPNSKSGSIKRQPSSGSVSITKELEDAVAAVLGTNVKVIFKTILKLEVRGDKLENRLLAFGTYRLYIFTVKGSAKLDHSYNYVDIGSLESHQANRLSLSFQSDSRHLTFQSCDPNQEEINYIIFHLATTIKTVFPHVPLESIIRKFDVEPSNRLDTIHDYVQSIEEKARFRLYDQPCGGFSNQYACFCDYYSVPFREEVAWDIDTIYAAHNHTELSILDFEHLDLKDLLPIIASLAYNGWFTKFRVSNVKLVNSGHSGSEQICEQIINLVRKSTTLEEIFLDNTGIRADFVNKLFSAMLYNNQTSIRVIDLSNNPIEDKGLKNMTAFVAKSFHMANLNTSNEDLSSSLSLSFSTSNYHPLPSSSSQSTGSANKTTSAKLMYKGLVHLNLSHCGISSKGISELSESLYLNKSMFTTLTYLNLSDNSFKDDLTKLYNFLAQPNNLNHLDLSGTDCNLESVFGALLHGCTNNLVHLNLSRNQFSSKKSNHKDLVIPASIKKFFSTAIFLRTLILSHSKLPPEVLKTILLGLACNESATDIRINLSSNDFKSNGAAVLELTLTDIRCISGIDLSDNGLDMDLIGVVNAISKNKSIKYLSIGRNFNNIKSKHLPKVLDSFVQLLQDPDCSLESLSLIDSKLKGETSIILNALGSNQSLINIDVSGNLMGLPGAKTLAKALQINNRLETIYLDRNFIPTAGFVDIAYALERNYTLKYLPVPVQDVQAAMIKLADRTEAAITKIQEFIRRNNLPQTAILRNLRMQNLANNNFILDNSLFTKIDRISVQLQKLMRMKTLEYSNRIPSVDSIEINLNSEQDNTIVADGCLDETIRIERLLRDAHNARQLCNKIQEVYSNSHAPNGYQSINDNFNRRFSMLHISRPIENNIVDLAKELKRIFENQVVTMSELMIQLIQDESPQLFAQSERLQIELKELYQNLISGTSGSTLVPSIEYFHMCLTESAATTWSVKLEQILHTIASQMCNRVLLEISRCLANAHQTLTCGGFESKSLDTDSCQIHLNGSANSTTVNSLTPDVLLRQPKAWPDSASSHESPDPPLQPNSDDNNAIATPKLQLPKRQNVYIRKLRPQSVLDGAIVASEEFSDLLPPKHNGFLSSSPNGDGSEAPKSVQHLTKSRPRARKTRAPTRVTLIDTKTVPEQPQKLDEGLDSFFSSASILEACHSNSSIDAKEPALIKDNGHIGLPAKPQPQPRKILRKFGFKSQGEQSNTNEHLHKQQTIDNSHLTSRNDSADLIGTVSPTMFSKRAEHVSICSEVESGRVHSPIPGGDIQQHNEFLAEMKAKQEKRSHCSTPLNEQLTFADGIQKRSSPETLESSKSEPNNNSAAFSVAKRATIFGELHKSPSKTSINQSSNGGQGGEEQHHNNNNHQPKGSPFASSIKQRPKSMVGTLGAKFELSIMNNSHK